MFDVETPAEQCAALGQRVRALRLQRNITQARLARDAGVSRPTLSVLERSGSASLETLARVLYALGRESELGGLVAPDPVMSLDALDAPTRQRARS